MAFRFGTCALVTLILTTFVSAALVATFAILYKKEIDIPATDFIDQEDKSFVYKWIRNGAAIALGISGALLIIGFIFSKDDKLNDIEKQTTTNNITNNTTTNITKWSNWNGTCCCVLQVEKNNRVHPNKNQTIPPITNGYPAPAPAWSDNRPMSPPPMYQMSQMSQMSQLPPLPQQYYPYVSAPQQQYPMKPT